MKKILFVFITAFVFVVAGLWYARDRIMTVVANMVATPMTGFFVHIDKVETARLESFFLYDISVKGSVERAPFIFRGKVYLMNPLLEEHRLEVSGFPLPAANRIVAKKAGILFDGGTAHVVSSGKASLKNLDMRANITLSHMRLHETKVSLVPFKTGLANFLLSKGSQFSIPLFIRGNPLHPQIIWPQSLQRVMNVTHFPSKVTRSVTNPFKKLFQRKKEK